MTNEKNGRSWMVRMADRLGIFPWGKFLSVKREGHSGLESQNPESRERKHPVAEQLCVLKWIGKGAREKGFRGTAKEGGSEDESFEWSGSNSSSLHYLLNLFKLLRVGETIVCEGEGGKGRWTLSRRLVENPMDHG